MSRSTLTALTPDGKRHIDVDLADADLSLADLLRQRGLPLNTRCGGRGLCDGCAVDLVEGTLQVGSHVARAPVSSIRGCAARLIGDAVVRLPQRVLLSYAPSVQDDFVVRISAGHDPLCEAPLGVAIDVGTTTVALALVDLKTGSIVARASGFNAQMHTADDVVTRITLCMNNPAMLLRLRAAIVGETIVPLLHSAITAANASVTDIGAIAIAGNTTMLHILAGVDPSPLAVAPFTPAFLEHRVLTGESVLGDTFAHATIHLLPGASAYIGADIVAGLTVTGMHYEPGICMLVDVGTNGEIVLKHRDRLIGCATAAGPAFEGARLASGMRAGRGAITSVRIDASHHVVDWIGREDRVQPAGLCGSAYIDFLAEARRVELLSPTGRFEPSDCLSTITGPRDFRVARGQGGRDIVITECDIASLLTAKAAIAAGIGTLLEVAGCDAGEIEHLFLAGGFGSRMNAANAIAIGMLPDFRSNQVISVGNTSLAGTVFGLLDRSLLREMSSLATRVQPIELNHVPSFEDRFTDSLRLP
ncbi:MAG: ASKHA domain-containing protein [Tepidisphaeraceae bacterium]